MYPQDIVNLISMLSVRVIDGKVLSEHTLVIEVLISSYCQNDHYYIYSAKLIIVDYSHQ